jgi:hypothetical protein
MNEASPTNLFRRAECRLRKPLPEHGEFRGEPLAFPSKLMNMLAFLFRNELPG